MAEVENPQTELRPVAGRGRKIAVAAAGTVVIGAGVVMLVTPGPGLVTIAAGLGILGTEFPTAKRILSRVRRRSSDPSP